MNVYPIGNNLTVKWTLRYSDGTVFPLSLYDYDLSYRTSRGVKVATDTTVEDNVLRWMLKADDQVVSGPYSLALKISFAGNKTVDLQYNNVFSLTSLSHGNGANVEVCIESNCDMIDLKDAVLQARKAMDVALAAEDIAGSAVNTADGAAATANEAKTIASTANNTSTEAKTIANNAKTGAEKAATDASRDAAAARQAAQTASDHITSLKQAIAELPDGQAVSEKVAEHTTKLSELEMQNGVFQYDTWESILLIENNGKYLAYPENILVNMSGYSYSNPIQVSKGDVVVFRAAGMANNVAMIAITDETASYYKSVCVANISSKKDYSYLVQEDGYVAFCWQTAGGYKLMKSSSAVLLDLLKDNRIQYQINVGKFISAEGLLVNNSGYCYTSAIEVKKGNTYLIKGVGVANNVAMVSLTDEALSYFIPITIYPISDVIYEYAFVADEDGFIVFSFRKNLTNEIRNITDEVFLSQKDADVTERYLGATREVVSLVENKGKYLAYPENKLVDMSGYSYSNPVKVGKGDVIEFHAAGAANNVILLAKTDETASSFSSLIVSASNYIKYYRNVITQDGYVVFCWDNTKPIKAYINHSETIKAILVENKIKSSHPLANINQPFTHIRCFKKITCIGDSLTQGVFDTTGYDVELMDYSYPAFLAKHTGIDVRNIGLGGDTASRQETGRSWFDQANARNLLIEGNIGDAVIIALGTNDISLYGEFTGNVDTDIDFSNRENNALTSVGGYANIIQYVRSIRPKSVIFMVTLSNTRNTLAQRNAMNEKVRALCQKFNNCYLIDMQMYAETTPEELSFFNAYYKNGGHNNALGYEYRARQMASYIDWIIANNLADFANIQFIDTSYTYDK